MMQKLFDEKVQQLLTKYPDLFPTEAKFWAYLRGCLRRGLWEKSAMKFKFKNSVVSPPPPDYTGRGKKGAECALTGEWTMTSKLEVDHIDGHKPLSSEDDILPYIVHLLATDDELQVVDKEAHKAKSYAERMGITFEQALLEKKAIAFVKQPKQAQETFFKQRGMDIPSNEKKRREAYIDALREESE